MSTPRYRKVKVGGCIAVQHQLDAEGVQRLRSAEPLQPYPARLTDRLEEWARHAPERVQVAQRGPDGQWRKITYAQMLDRVRRIGQALALRGLSAERPIAILSDNDLEHYTLALAAQWVGVPYTPVSVAYSTDVERLRQAQADRGSGRARAHLCVERAPLCAGTRSHRPDARGNRGECRAAAGLAHH